MKLFAVDRWCRICRHNSNVKEVEMLGVSMVALSPELALILELVKQRKDFAHPPLYVQGSCGNNGIVRA